MPARCRSFPPALLLRLANAVILGPLTLHLTARFPRRSPLSNRWIALAYGVSLALFALFLMASERWLPLTFLALTLSWMAGLLLLALYQMITTSRDASSGNRRAAQQARLLLFSLVLANAGILLRLLGYATSTVQVPYDLALVTQVFLPCGIAYAILHHDLFGIDATLRRGLAYTLLIDPEYLKLARQRLRQEAQLFSPILSVTCQTPCSRHLA